MYIFAHRYTILAFDYYNKSGYTMIFKNDIVLYPPLVKLV